MSDTEENDVFLAGYPKSGNTWCQTCLAAIVYGLDVSRVSNAVVQTLIPDVHFRNPYYLRLQSPTCFKTHALPQPHYRRAIYLVRDGRDATTSFHRFLGDERNRPRALRGPRENDWEWIMRYGSFNSTLWHDHVRAWRENPYGADLLVIRYEDMKSNPVRVLGRMAEFVGVKHSRKQLKQIAEITSFDRMKRRDGRFNALLKNPRQIVRRGAVGSYKDEMPPEILEQFENMAGDTLHEMGYAA